MIADQSPKQSALLYLGCCNTFDSGNPFTTRFWATERRRLREMVHCSWIHWLCASRFAATNGAQSSSCGIDYSTSPTQCLEDARTTSSAGSVAEFMEVLSTPQQITTHSSDITYVWTQETTDSGPPGRSHVQAMGLYRLGLASANAVP